MKARSKLSVVCCFMAVVMMLPGCGSQSTGSQSNTTSKAGKPPASGQVSKKAKDTSDYLLSRVKFYSQLRKQSKQMTMFEYS